MGRYLDGKSPQEGGVTLGGNKNGAKMRVNRVVHFKFIVSSYAIPAAKP